MFFFVFVSDDITNQNVMNPSKSAKPLSEVPLLIPSQMHTLPPNNLEFTREMAPLSPAPFSRKMVRAPPRNSGSFWVSGEEVHEDGGGRRHRGGRRLALVSRPKRLCIFE